MNENRAYRFFATPIVWLGITSWLILTYVASRSEIVANNYELPLIVFGVAITALSMACVAGWAMLLLTLVVNWIMAVRRAVFRKRLLEWSALFGIVTVFAVWSAFYLHS